MGVGQNLLPRIQSTRLFRERGANPAVNGKSCEGVACPLWEPQQKRARGKQREKIYIRYSD